MEIRPVVAVVFQAVRRKGGLTDKLVVAYCSIAKAPKIYSQFKEIKCFFRKALLTFMPFY
jgi:hypothetical protein